jgi:hypothetical protein
MLLVSLFGEQTISNDAAKKSRRAPPPRTGDSMRAGTRYVYTLRAPAANTVLLPRSALHRVLWLDVLSWRGQCVSSGGCCGRVAFMPPSLCW